MKKIYNAPNTIVVNIRPNHLMQGSQLGVGDEYGGGAVLSRDNRSGWDDDEEDY